MEKKGNIESIIVILKWVFLFYSFSSWISFHFGNVISLLYTPTWHTEYMCITYNAHIPLPPLIWSSWRAEWGATIKGGKRTNRKNNKRPIYCYHLKKFLFLVCRAWVDIYNEYIWSWVGGRGWRTTARTRSNWKTNEKLFEVCFRCVICEAFLRAIWCTQRDSKNPAFKSTGLKFQDKMNVRGTYSLISRFTKQRKPSIGNEEFKRKAETTPTS